MSRHDAGWKKTEIEVYLVKRSVEDNVIKTQYALVLPDGSEPITTLHVSTIYDLKELGLEGQFSGNCWP